MKMPSVMRGSRMSKVPRAEIRRSQFNRSHGHKTTFDAGLLVPVYVDEALPGDTFNMKMSGFARLSTPLKPLMDNLYMDTFFFAVPYRLLWDNWEKFNGAQDSPGASTSYVIPQMAPPSASGYVTGTLQDYFGIPIGFGTTTTSWTHSALPGRAYYLIWNEWFRDQNLQASKTQLGTNGIVTTHDGPDNSPVGGTPLMRRGKRHDYFTSCLPWPQKGPAVELPIGDSAPVEPDGTGFPGFSGSLGGGPGTLVAGSAGANVSANAFTIATNWTGGETLQWTPTATGLEADLSSATGATINALREAFQIQKLLERDARGGTRYTEIVKSHFGVTSPDARLQRPEYLGGGSAPIVISPIAQNSATATEPTPQGNLAAIGTGSFTGHGFVKSFTEHCILIGMVCVRADLTYQRGMERMWSRSTRYDFYWPAFAQLGEQEVLNKEIYLYDHPNDDNVFGYQERYAEYRYKPSLITGSFRSILAVDYSIWHLSQEFTTLPTLGDVFIEEDPPIDRVVAVPTEPHFLFDSYFDLKCARPMPMYSVPGMIDHF